MCPVPSRVEFPYSTSYSCISISFRDMHENTMPPLPTWETKLRDGDLPKTCPESAVSLLSLSIIYGLGTHLRLRRKKEVWNSYPQLPSFSTQSVRIVELCLLWKTFSEQNSVTHPSGNWCKKPLCSKFTPSFYNNFPCRRARNLAHKA